MKKLNLNSKTCASIKEINTMRSTRTFSRFMWKWRWKSIEMELMKSRGVIFNTILVGIVLMIRPISSHPVVSSQSDCDWNGRGTLFSSTSSAAQSIQTMTLRCTRGQIHWEDPIGGLRVEIYPNLKSPYKLCLEDSRQKGSSQTRHHRILLEESSGRLLQVLSSVMKNSDCYEISGPSAVLYVESHGGGVSETSQVNSVVTRKTGEAAPISIAYEMESMRGDGDPCRPCSEAEALRAYCSADVVARGSILQIVPGKQYDWIYIRSDLVIHQNHPVFTPLSPPLVNFLTTKPLRFDMDKPQKVTRNTQRGQMYQGIISHPTTCSASVGEGDFLWLIKFRFGIPMTDCVLYWDKWAELAMRGGGECPMSTGQED